MSCLKECFERLSIETISVGLLTIVLLIMLSLGGTYIEDFALKFFLMFLSGMIGGIVSYFYSKMLTNNVKEKELMSCIAVGIGASLLMPFLFPLISGHPLNMISDPLDINNGNGYLKLISWCLLAGISGEPLITTALEKFKFVANDGNGDAKDVGNDGGNVLQNPVADADDVENPIENAPDNSVVDDAENPIENAPDNTVVDATAKSNNIARSRKLTK